MIFNYLTELIKQLYFICGIKQKIFQFFYSLISKHFIRSDFFVHRILSSSEILGEYTSTKMPKNWKNFWLDSTNNTELFDYLSQVVENHNFPEGKSFFITKGQEVISKNTNHKMETCTHEEANTRIMVHILHAIQQGAKKIMVRTVDTDVLVILIGHFFVFTTAVFCH